MTIQTIEAEADTLEEARALLAKRIPAGLTVTSEKVISDGQPTTVDGFAPTLEEARAKAQGAVPTVATILGIEEVTPPERKTIAVDAPNERSARLQVATQFGPAASVTAAKLATPGKKGFLGIGKQPGHFEVDVAVSAHVRITYRSKARVSAEVADLKYLWRQKAVDWWRTQGSNLKVCDACHQPIARDGGYLLSSDEVLQSDAYVAFAVRLRSESAVTQTNVPGMDSYVMAALMPVVQFKVRSEVIASIQADKTPWLVCQRCLERYF